MPDNNLSAFIRQDPKLKKTLKQFSLLYILLAVSISISGYLFYKNQETDIKNEKQNDLSIIAELKASQIINWRNERLDDTLSLAYIFNEDTRVKQVFKNSGQNKNIISSWLRRASQSQEYVGIYVLDPSMKEIASISKNSEPLGQYALGCALEAFNSKKINFTELHRNEVTNNINLDVIVPIIEDNRALGVILLRIDPQKFLYPFIQSWPSENKTSETLLVKKEGNNVVYLNELKYRKNTALTYFLPMDMKERPAVMAARGIQGVVEGVDYHGVPVLAVIKSIPETSWILIAQVDKDEIYGSIRSRAWSVGILVFILVASLGFGMGFLWYQQIALFFKKQYDTEREKKVLAKRYDYVTKYANDIIIIFNKGLQIVEANDRATEAYKYTHAELLTKNLKDLRTPESLKDLPNELNQIDQKGSLIYEAIHRRKDGSTFPVEVSMRTLVIEWDEFYHAIIRDTSERKQNG